MDSDCDKLIKWLNTFDLPKPISSVNDLNNGDVFCKILTELCPDYFTADWSSKIKKDVSSDWRIKASNLKKILKGLLDYYKKKLGINISETHIPDVNCIAEEEDATEATKLLQLLLGCAVSCASKEEHVQRIMALEEDLQHFVMLAIKEIMSSSDSQTSDSDQSVQAVTETEAYKKLCVEKREVEERCTRMSKQLSFVTDEKSALKSENEHLQQQLKNSNILHHSDTPANRRLQQLQKQLEQCQDELFKAETVRDEYKIKCVAMEEDTVQLHLKVEKLGEMTKETRDLRDEIDILKHHADKTAKYESTITSLKKKLEDNEELKTQLKLLEEASKRYIEQNFELHEELKKLPQLKFQLDTYKKQLVELQLKSSEQEKQLDKAEFEFKRCRDKMDGLLKDKERLMEENISLKEQNEELSVMQSSHSAANVLPSNENGLSHFMNVSPEIREELVKLQHENKLLKSRGGEETDSSEGDLLQSLLNDSNRTKEKLESKLRVQNRKIMELEAKIEDMLEANPQLRLPQHSEPPLSQQPHPLQPQHLLQSTNKSQNFTFSNSCELKSHLKSIPELTSEVERLRLVLRGKEDQIRCMEKKYQNYLDKAKYIMQQERPQPPQPTPNIIHLQDQIIQKDNYIMALQSTIKINETEQRMMMSAFHNLSIASHKRTIEEKLSKNYPAKLLLQSVSQPSHTSQPAHPSQPNSSSQPKQSPLITQPTKPILSPQPSIFPQPNNPSKSSHTSQQVNSPQHSSKIRSPFQADDALKSKKSSFTSNLPRTKPLSKTQPGLNTKSRVALVTLPSSSSLKQED